LDWIRLLLIEKEGAEYDDDVEEAEDDDQGPD